MTTGLPLYLIGAASVLLVLFVVLERRAHRNRPPAGRAATALARPAPAASKRRARRDVPHALYVYLHRFGGYVYVGISNHPERRHEGHEAKSPWFGQSTGVMQIVQWYPNWAAARVAEDALIARLALGGHPIANDQGNPLRRSRRAA